MYVEHVVFNTPDNDVVLGRSLNFTKFVYLLQRSAQHFARVHSLGDPFEGARSLSGRERSSTGLYYKVSLGILIGQIRVASYADEWFIDLARSIAEPHGLAELIQPSNMKGEAVWHLS